MKPIKSLSEKREIVNSVLKLVDSEQIPVRQAIDKLKDQGLNISKDVFYDYKKDIETFDNTKSTIVADAPQLIKSNTIFDNPIQSNSEQTIIDNTQQKEPITISKANKQPITISKKLTRSKKRINISLSDEIIEWLEKEADFSSVPVANQCSKIISDYVRERLK